MPNHTIKETGSSLSCLKRGPSWMVLLVALLGTFSSFYPQSAINVLLPVIAKDLSVDTSLIVIVVIAFSLISGVLTLPFGRLGDRIGYQKLFLTGQIVLIVGNFLSMVLTLNFALLLLFRCIIAVGAAMVQSVVQAMLSQAYPGNRGRMMGLYSMSVSYSGAFSPLISGGLSDLMGWRPALAFGMVFSLVSMLLGGLFLGKFQCKPTASDRTGTALLLVALSSLMIALNARTVALPTVWTIVLLAIFVISAVFFVRVENRAEAPLLDLSLLKNKKVALGFIGCMLGYIISTSVNQALPFYIQDVKLQSATVSSLCTIGFTLAQGTLGPFTGGWCDKKGPYKLMLAAMCIQTAAVVGYCALGESTSLALVIIFVVLYGVGGGLFYAPITSMVMGSVPPSSGGVASGMMSTARNLGGGLGATIFSVAVGVVAANSSAGTSASQVYMGGQRAAMFIMLGLNVVSILIMFYLYRAFGREKKAI